MIVTAMALGSLPTAAMASPFPGHRTVPDDDLEDVRGGFDLPNGMAISVGIEITTLVNGALALRTALMPESGATPSVYVGDTTSPAAVSGASGGVTVQTPSGGIVRINDGSASSPISSADQTPVTLVANGPGVATPWGDVQLVQTDRGSTVTLAGNSLQLQHMIGSITGSAVANTADNRAIDTIVTVNVDLHNASMLAGNALLRLESFAVDAASRIIR
nr:hypothetical protein [Sphingomonas laterariae]